MSFESAQKAYDNQSDDNRLPNPCNCCARNSHCLEPECQGPIDEPEYIKEIDQAIEAYERIKGKLF